MNLSWRKCQEAFCEFLSWRPSHRHRGSAPSIIHPDLSLGHAPGDEVLRIALSPARLRLRLACAGTPTPSKTADAFLLDYQEETTFDKIDKDAFGLAETSLSLPHGPHRQNLLCLSIVVACGHDVGRRMIVLGVYGSPGGGSCGSCGKPGVLGGFSKRLVGIAKRFQRPCGRLVWARTGTRLGRYFKSSTGPSAAAASTGL